MGLKVLCCDKWVNMLLLNVIARLWWQPKETGTFPLPPNTAPKVCLCRHPGHLVTLLHTSVCQPLAESWQAAWDSCSCCWSAVFLAVPGINLFSRLAPSPGKRLSAGGWCWRRGLLGFPALLAEGNTVISWQTARPALLPCPGSPHSTLPEPVLCRQHWKEDFFFFFLRELKEITVFDVVAWFCTELSAAGADSLSLCQIFLWRVENATDKNLRLRKMAFLVNRINLNEVVPRSYMKMRADP